MALGSMWQGDGVRSTSMHVASLPTIVPIYLPSGRSLHLTRATSADWTLRFPLRGVLGSRSPLVILRVLNSAEPRNSTCRGVAPTSVLPAGLKIATMRPTTPRLEGQIVTEEEGVPEGLLIFYVNNPVCTHCGSSPSITFHIRAPAATEVCSDGAQQNGSEKHTAQQWFFLIVAFFFFFHLKTKFQWNNKSLKHVLFIFNRVKEPLQYFERMSVL